MTKKTGASQNTGKLETVGIEQENATVNMVRLLEQYSRGILSYLEDERLLYGCAVRMRKSVEAMGAYLLCFHTSGGTQNPVRNGEEVLPRLKQKRNEPAIGAFLGMRDSLLRGAGSNAGVNWLMHYQAAQEGTDTYQSKEEEYLIADHQIFCESLPVWRELVSTFLACAPEVSELIETGRSIPSLRRLLDPDHGKLTENCQRSCARARTDISGMFHQGEHEVDPWLDWHCSLLDRYADQTMSSAVKYDLICVITRKITERTAVRFLWSRDMGAEARKIKTDDDNAKNAETLDQYIQALRNTPRTSPGDETVLPELISYSGLVQAKSNARIHWHDGVWESGDLNTAPEGTRGPITHEMEQLSAASSAIVRNAVVNGQPEYAWKWVQRNKEKLDRIIRRNRRDKLTLLCLIALLIAGVILAVVFLVRYNSEEQVRLAEELERTAVYHYEYSDYIWRNGVPEGIGSMTAEEAAGIPHYDLSVVDGKVRSLRYLSANGTLIDEYLTDRLDRPARIEVEYNADLPDRIALYNADGDFLVAARYDMDAESGQLTHIRLVDSSDHAYVLPANAVEINLSAWTDGTVGIGESFSGISDLEVRSIENGQVTELAFGWDEVQKDGNGAEGVLVSYDQEGRPKTLSVRYDAAKQDNASLLRKSWRYDGYLLDETERVQTDESVQIIRYSYSNGFCTAENYVNLLGQESANSRSLTRISYVYDEHGLLAWKRLFGENGDALRGSDGWASVYYEWDDRGRNIVTAYFDTYNNPIEAGGWARRTRTYDGDNFVTQWFLADGRPGFSGRDYARCSVVSEKSQGGEITHYSWFTADGKPAMHQGAYQWRITKDENGDEILSECLDAGGSRMVSNETGYSYYTSEYSRHRLTARCFYDAGGKPVRSASGYAKREIRYSPSMGLRTDVFDYDESEKLLYHLRYTYQNGRVAAQEYLDGEGKPLFSSAAGYARKTVAYTNLENGVEVLTRYEDEKGDLTCTVRKGEISIAASRACYDRNGYVTLQESFDAQMQPVYDPDLFCYILETTYDGRGNKTSWQYLDDRGELMLREGMNYARFTAVYNNNNQELENAYYGTDGQLTVNSSCGYAMLTMQYLENGKCSGWTYYGADGEPVTLPSVGYASIIKTYDEAGRIVAEAYLDQDGQPVLSGKGYAKTIMRYDGRGNCTLQSYYGTDDRLRIPAFTSYASVERAFDEAGRIISERYLDTNGRQIACGYGYAKTTWAYDGSGNCTECRYYASDGELIIRPSTGYAAFRRRFDSSGRLIEEEYLDADLERVTTVFGYAKALYEYDEEGAASESYFDEDGNLLPTGRITCKVQYNDSGEAVSCSYYDRDGKLVDNPYCGYATIRKEYDAAGNCTAQYFLNAHGQPTLSAGGYAKVINRYDGHGNCTGVSYYGTDGRLTAPASIGYAVLNAVYDEAWHLTEKSFFDEKGLPVLNSDGYAKVVYGYDEHGNNTSVSYYGQKGEPISVGGYAMLTYEYDDSGRCTGWAYYDEDHSMIVLPSVGYAAIRIRYDDAGHVTEESYYDAQGQPVLSVNGYARVVWQYNDDGEWTDTFLYDENGDPLDEY